MKPYNEVSNLEESEEWENIDKDDDYKTRFSDFEFLILNNIVFDEKYRNKAFSSIEPIFFENLDYGVIFGHMQKYIEEYNTVPSYKEVSTIISKDVTPSGSGTEDRIIALREMTRKIYAKQQISDTHWLIENSETWLKQKKMFSAIMRCSELFNERSTNGEISYDDFASIIEEAQGASIKTSTSSDIFDPEYLEEFLEYIYSERRRIPFLVDILNKVTDGGITRKSLCIACAPTNGGKSLHLASHMADYARQGYNCLYVTFELSKHETTARFVGNYLEKNAIDIEDMGKGSEEKKTIAKKFIKENIIEFQQKNNAGLCMVSEYIAGVHTVSDIEQEIKNIKLNKGVDIDIVFVDYIKNMRPINVSKNASEYTKLGANSLALKGLANKMDISVWTAMQLSRASESKEHITKEDIAESLAIAFDADFMYAFKYNMELDAYKCWKLKSRMSSMTDYCVFKIGTIIPQFRLYDTDQKGLEAKIDLEEELENKESFKPTSNGFGNNFGGGFNY